MQEMNYRHKTLAWIKKKTSLLVNFWLCFSFTQSWVLHFIYSFDLPLALVSEIPAWILPLPLMLPCRIAFWEMSPNTCGYTKSATIFRMQCTTVENSSHNWLLWTLVDSLASLVLTVQKQPKKIHLEIAKKAQSWINNYIVISFW